MSAWPCQGWVALARQRQQRPDRTHTQSPGPSAPAETGPDPHSEPWSITASRDRSPLRAQEVSCHYLAEGRCVVWS